MNFKTHVRWFLAAICLAGLAGADDGSDPVSIRVVRPYTYRVEGKFFTKSPRESVWIVLRDYENIPRYSPSVNSSVVVSRQGNLVLLKQEGTAGFLFFKRKFVMEMKVVEGLPDRIDFEETSHRDFEKYVGSWQARPSGGGTEVSYVLEAVADFGPLVNWAAKDYIRSNSKDSLKRLKEAINAQPPPARPTTKAALLPLLRAPTPAAPKATRIPTPSLLSLGIAKGSNISLEGTSTLHPFTCRSDTLNLKGKAEGGRSAGVPVLIRQKKVKTFLLSLPVESLKSGEGGLDTNLYKAMDSGRYPEISFNMDSYQTAGDRVSASGLLTIHGTARPVTLHADLSGDSLTARLKGEYRLKMKDYGVEPPRLFLGTIRVGEEATIRFDLNLAAGD